MCGTLQQQFHPWIKPMKRVPNKSLKQLQQIYPTWKESDLETLDKVITDSMALADVEVAQFGIAKRLVSLEEVAVPAGPVMSIPAVPDPLVFEGKNHSLSSELLGASP